MVRLDRLDRRGVGRAARDHQAAVVHVSSSQRAARLAARPQFTTIIPVENTTPDRGPRRAVAPTVSRAQRAVLDVLLAADRPLPLARLSTETGLHANTLRGHLDALAEHGLARRERAEPTGRGRPGWLWSAARIAPGEYAGLATALARTLHRTSADPAGDAVEAGRAWGHELAAAGPAAGADVPGRTRVRDLLAGLGFGPERAHPDSDTTLRLTRCPLLDAARELPEVVCNVHLGLVGGALEEYRSDDVDADLVPFAEPGACLLHLPATGARR
jgi:predicted ArsR family transcriptional regulator